MRLPAEFDSQVSSQSDDIEAILLGMDGLKTAQVCSAAEYPILRLHVVVLLQPPVTLC